MTADKIRSLSKVQDQVRVWRRQDKKVVFTNGCFDILHLGHVDYLEKAAAFGNKLIVAINSDKSIAKLKGSKRPVVRQEARARIIAALEFVDLVVIFDEETPLKLIEKVLPDILVKGNDYLAENIVGADIVIKNGGTVETIPLVEGYSTSGIIDKIKG